MDRTLSISKQERERRLRGGTWAGVAGGVALSIWNVLMQLSQGHGFWAGFKGASAPLFHARAMQPGFDLGPVLVGALVHFAVSIAWGVLFAIVADGLSRGMTLFAGFFWGLVVWAGMFYVALPLVGLGDVARSVPVGAALVEDVVFGVVAAAAYLPFQRDARVDLPWDRRLA